MKRLFLVAAITSLLATMASISWAATNLSSSRSNNYRVVYSADGMTSTQAAALGAELDKMPRVDEAAVRKTLQKLFIPTNFKKIGIRPGKPITIILLTDPADWAQAIAVSDPGAPADKPSKGTK